MAVRKKRGTLGDAARIRQEAERYRFCYVNNFTDMDCKYRFLSP